MPGRVRAVFRQLVLLGGVAGGDAIERKRANAHVFLFRAAGRQIAGVFNHIGQQFVELRRVFLGDWGTKGAGEGIGHAARAEVGILCRQLPALGIAQQTPLLIHRLIV